MQLLISSKCFKFTILAANQQISAILGEMLKKLLSAVEYLVFTTIKWTFKSINMALLGVLQQLQIVERVPASLTIKLLMIKCLYDKPMRLNCLCSGLAMRATVLHLSPLLLTLGTVEFVALGTLSWLNHNIKADDAFEVI